MSFPEVAVIVSDDARQELGGKLTIVGVYTAEMVFVSEEAPTVIPRLSFTFLCRWPNEGSREPIALEVYFPGEESEAGVQFSADPRTAPVSNDLPASERRGFLANMVVELIPLKAMGMFTVYATAGGERKEVYKLRVRHVAPGSTASAVPPIPEAPA